MAGTEPSDGLRVSNSATYFDVFALRFDRLLQVVNALLTQLDKLKHRKNVLVMSTSNLVKAIGVLIISSVSHPLDVIFIFIWITDSAFVDRADIVQYVDLPPREAVYEILRTSLCEIINRGLVSSTVGTRYTRSLNYLTDNRVVFHRMSLVSKRPSYTSVQLQLILLR